MSGASSLVDARVGLIDALVRVDCLTALRIQQDPLDALSWRGALMLLVLLTLADVFLLDTLQRFLLS